jgi:hypothetical protein
MARPQPLPLERPPEGALAEGVGQGTPLPKARSGAPEVSVSLRIPGGDAAPA